MEVMCQAFSEGGRTLKQAHFEVRGDTESDSQDRCWIEGVSLPCSHSSDSIPAHAVETAGALVHLSKKHSTAMAGG